MNVKSLAINLTDIAKKVGRISRAFRRKSWASRIAGLTAYTAIPTTFADMVLGHGIGVGAALVGTAAQFISDAVERSRMKHWISLGTDLIRKAE